MPNKMDYESVPEDDLPDELKSSAGYEEVPLHDLPENYFTQQALNPSETEQFYNPWANLPKTLTGAASGVGGALENVLSNGIIGSASPQISQMQGQELHKLLGGQPNQNLSQSWGAPQDIPTRSGELAGSALPFLASPEVSLPEFFGSQSVSRILPQIAMNAAANQDPLKGALEGAAFQTAGEALPIAGQTLKKLGQFSNPTELTQKLSDQISQGLKTAQDKAGKYYKKVLGEHGQKDIYENMPQQTELPKESMESIESGLVPGRYTDFDKDTIDKYFPLGSTVNRAHNLFVDQPTLEHANFLRKILGEKIGDLKPKARIDTSAEQQLALTQQLRKRLDADTITSLNNIDPQAAKTWQKGINTYREEAAPYKSGAKLMDIASGNRTVTDPKELVKTLSKEIEKQNPRTIPQNHPLNDILNQIQHAGNRGRFWGDLVPEGVKKWLPKAGKMSGNPYGTELGQKLSPYYQALKNALVVNAANQNRGNQ